MEGAEKWFTDLEISFSGIRLGLLLDQQFIINNYNCLSYLSFCRVTTRLINLLIALIRRKK